MLVPLCVREGATPAALELSEKYSMFVAWFAPVEVRGAFARMVRIRQITPNQQVQAIARLDIYRIDWREVLPSLPLREKAEDFVDRFPLRAADALQLASAWMWCHEHPRGRPFISGDLHLLDTARHLGFQVLQPG
jgi:predicted nucleic acid-binding protein